MLASTVELIALFFQGLGLLSLILVLLQISNSNKWKRLEFTMNELWQSKIITYSCQIEKKSAEKGLKRNMEEPISIEDAKEIIKDEDLYNCLNDYLNNLEEIACMCNIGAMHDKYAYQKFSSNLLYAYEYYKNFIDEARKHENDSLIFIEMQKLYRKWKTADDREKQEEKTLQERFEKRHEREKYYKI